MLKHAGNLSVLCQNCVRSTRVFVEGRNYSKNLPTNVDISRRKTERFWKLTNAKNLKPLEVSVTSQRPLKRRPGMDQFPSKTFDKPDPFKRLDPEFYRNVQNMDLEMEPNLAQIESEYDEHWKEKNYGKLAGRRQKMTRKHFKEHLPQEVSILTWAEKENIRFLHKTNPDEWTPEDLAAAFPITVNGVEKLLKSKFQCHSKDQILRHDKAVQVKMELIKKGTIPATKELLEKMKIREKIPLQLGLLPSNAKELAFAETPRAFGEFARLVASPERIREIEENRKEASRQKFDAEKMKEKTDQIFVKEMERLNIRHNDRLTLSQFEEKLKSSQSVRMSSNPLNRHQFADESNASNPQVKYLLDMKQVKKPTAADAAEIIEETSPSKDGPTAEDFLTSYIPKFKPKARDNLQDKEIQNDNGPNLKIENGEAYIFDHKTGYQKPFAPVTTSSEDSINIPEGKRLPGCTYQVGNDFYDEDGEFLYRVI